MRIRRSRADLPERAPRQHRRNRNDAIGRGSSTMHSAGAIDGTTGNAQAHPWHGIPSSAGGADLFNAFIEIVPADILNSSSTSSRDIFASIGPSASRASSACGTYFLTDKQRPDDAAERVRLLETYGRDEALEMISGSMADYERY